MGGYKRLRDPDAFVGVLVDAVRGDRVGRRKAPLPLAGIVELARIGWMGDYTAGSMPLIATDRPGTA